MTTEPPRGYHDDDPEASTNAPQGKRAERLLLPNTTQVPNVILDWWMATLTGAMLKIVLYVCRRTYGFGRASDRISVQQIVAGITRKDGTRLDCGTGLSRSQTIATLGDLEEVTLIFKHSVKAADGRDLSPEYSLNLAADPAEVARKLGEIKTRRSSRTAAKKAEGAGGPKTGPSPSRNRTLPVQKPDPQNLVAQNPGKPIDRGARAREAGAGSTDRLSRQADQKPWKALEATVDREHDDRASEEVARVADDLVRSLDLRPERARKLARHCVARGEDGMLLRAAGRVAESKPRHPWPTLLAAVLNARHEEGGGNGGKLAGGAARRKEGYEWLFDR